MPFTHTPDTATAVLGRCTWCTPTAVVFRFFNVCYSPCDYRRGGYRLDVASIDNCRAIPGTGTTRMASPRSWRTVLYQVVAHSSRVYPFKHVFILRKNFQESFLRPFLMQSDSASRKRPFSTGLFFDWIFFDWILLVLIVSRVDFIVFVLFLEAVGVREYCCTAGEIGWQLCASRCLREQRLDEPSSQRVGCFGLSRKPPKLRSWSCTQPRAAKATAGAAVVGRMGSRPRAAAVV